MRITLRQIYFEVWLLFQPREVKIQALAEEIEVLRWTVLLNLKLHDRCVRIMGRLDRRLERLKEKEEFI